MGGCLADPHRSSQTPGRRAGCCRRGGLWSYDFPMDFPGFPMIFYDFLFSWKFCDLCWAVSIASQPASQPASKPASQPASQPDHCPPRLGTSCKPAKPAIQPASQPVHGYIHGYIRGYIQGYPWRYPWIYRILVIGISPGFLSWRR